MVDLSLRQYLKLKDASTNQGIRWCAPSLGFLSLRCLLRGINRRIIHLSDLHIGLNNDPIPSIQFGLIVDAIIETYPEADNYNDPENSPKPIVVITGDIVDYAHPADHLITACVLFERLRENGFTVLVVPGNHDYSDTFSVHSFTPLETIPGVGDLINIVATCAMLYIGKGQSPNLVSGMTFSPIAASNFKEKMASYIGQNGYFFDSWKDKGAVFDLNFLLLDGQDKNPQRPPWDDPWKLVYSATYAALKMIEIPVIGGEAVDDSTADALANNAANLADNPDILYDKTYFAIFAALEPILLLPTLTHQVAEKVAIAAKEAAISPLDSKFFLNNGNFRLAHGYLDSTGLQSFKTMVDSNGLTKTLSVACIHYWLNYPEYGYTASDDADNTLINENELFDFETLDHCHLLLTGHIHEETYKSSANEEILRHYHRMGSPVPNPMDWLNEHTMRSHRRWCEISINLNTKETTHKYIEVCE